MTTELTVTVAWPDWPGWRTSWPPGVVTLAVSAKTGPKEGGASWGLVPQVLRAAPSVQCNDAPLLSVEKGTNSCWVDLPFSVSAWT